jgi:hypothetical protein
MNDDSIFGKPILWRDTAKTPRLVIFDARLVFFFFLLALHLRVWTFFTLIVAILAFWAVERYGYALPNALRAIRNAIAGARRPAQPGYRYRTGVDYGFEALRPHQPAAAPAEAPEDALLKEASST